MRLEHYINSQTRVIAIRTMKKQKCEFYSIPTTFTYTGCYFRLQAVNKHQCWEIFCSRISTWWVRSEGKHCHKLVLPSTLQLVRSTSLLTRCDIARSPSRHLYWTKTKAYFEKGGVTTGVQGNLCSSGHIAPKSPAVAHMHCAFDQKHLTNNC